MTVMYRMAQAMTVTAIAGTLYLAAYEQRWGLVIAGYLISVFGIITCAINGDRIEKERHQ